MTREQYKAQVEKLIDEECKKGKHNFQEIAEYGATVISIVVVRWCVVCGAIVIDEDYDCRTNPGAVMKMKSPAITKALS